MKRIINPVPWWRRLGELIELRAEAIRRHRRRSHIEAEMRDIRTGLTAWANRRDERTAA